MKKLLVGIGAMFAIPIILALGFDHDRATAKAEFDKLPEKQQLAQFIRTNGGEGEYYLYSAKVIAEGTPAVDKKKRAEARAAKIAERTQARADSDYAQKYEQR